MALSDDFAHRPRSQPFRQRRGRIGDREKISFHSGSAQLPRSCRSVAAQLRSVANHIRAGRRRKSEKRRVDRRVALERIEGQLRQLTEVVMQLHRSRQIFLESDANVVESGVWRFGLCFDKFDSVRVAAIDQNEIYLEYVAACQQRSRRRAERAIQLLDDYLIEIAIINPEFFTIADEQLRIRLVIAPAELARPSERECAAGSLRHTSRLGRNDLSERRLAGARAVDERPQLVDAGGCGHARKRNRQRHCSNDRAETPGPHAASPLPAGTRTSRLPLVCMGETIPARSICSIKRAARL